MCSGHFKRDCPDAEQEVTTGALALVKSSVLVANNMKKDMMLFDTGVGEHITYIEEGFINFQKTPGKCVRQADGTKLEAKGHASLELTFN